MHGSHAVGGIVGVVAMGMLSGCLLDRPTSGALGYRTGVVIPADAATDYGVYDFARPTRVDAGDLRVHVRVAGSSEAAPRHFAWEVVHYDAAWQRVGAYRLTGELRPRRAGLAGKARDRFPGIDVAAGDHLAVLGTFDAPVPPGADVAVRYAYVPEGVPSHP